MHINFQVLYSRCLSTAGPSRDSEAPTDESPSACVWIGQNALCGWRGRREDKGFLWCDRAEPGGQDQSPKTLGKNLTSNVPGSQRIQFPFVPQMRFARAQRMHESSDRHRGFTGKKDTSSNLEERSSPQTVLVPDVRERELQSKGHPRHHS